METRAETADITMIEVLVITDITGTAIHMEMVAEMNELPAEIVEGITTVGIAELIQTTTTKRDQFYN